MSDSRSPTDHPAKVPAAEQVADSASHTASTFSSDTAIDTDPGFSAYIKAFAPIAGIVLGLLGLLVAIATWTQYKQQAKELKTLQQNHAVLYSQWQNEAERMQAQQNTSSAMQKALDDHTIRLSSHQKRINLLEGLKGLSAEQDVLLSIASRLRMAQQLTTLTGKRSYLLNALTDIRTASLKLPTTNQPPILAAIKQDISKIESSAEDGYSINQKIAKANNDLSAVLWVNQQPELPKAATTESNTVEAASSPSEDAAENTSDTTNTATAAENMDSEAASSLVPQVVHNWAHDTYADAKSTLKSLVRIQDVSVNPLLDSQGQQQLLIQCQTLLNQAQLAVIAGDYLQAQTAIQTAKVNIENHAQKHPRNTTLLVDLAEIQSGIRGLRPVRATATNAMLDSMLQPTSP